MSIERRKLLREIGTEIAVFHDLEIRKDDVTIGFKITKSDDQYIMIMDPMGLEQARDFLRIMRQVIIIKETSLSRYTGRKKDGTIRKRRSNIKPRFRKSRSIRMQIQEPIENIECDSEKEE